MRIRRTMGRRPRRLVVRMGIRSLLLGGGRLLGELLLEGWLALRIWDSKLGGI